MEVTYRLATQDDIDLLVEQRLDFIQVSENSSDYEMIKASCYAYFEKALLHQTCDVVLAEESGVCIGTGIAFYYDSVPSILNPAGKNAYITSMYVKPEYRCAGIGNNILMRIIECAKEKDYNIIMLNASTMGRPMYEKVGFTEIRGGMILEV
ncbi:MAG: GNAT family N-acetyltransferase [Lachnospiraceae bacterium]|nr:GNAT family N-acetyltransferase [Lachnospiraceae bacterium]